MSVLGEELLLKHMFSLRIFTKLLGILSGFGVLFVAIIWTRASLAWGATSAIQWIWLFVCVAAGVASLAASVKTVSSEKLWFIIGVDIVLAGLTLLI